MSENKLTDQGKVEWAAAFKALAAEKYEQFKTTFAEIKAKYNIAPAVPVAASTIPPAAPATPAPATTPQPYSANITGGAPIFTDISDDGIPGVDMGDAVFTDATLATPYPDGTYTLDDGSSVTVAGGVVTVCAPGMPADSSAPMPGMSQFKAQFKAESIKFGNELRVEFLEAFSAKFAAQQIKITELETALSDHNLQLKHLVEFADMALTTPVATSAAKPAKPWNEMSGLEQSEYRASLRK